jgi:hypothetical protein
MLANVGASEWQSGEFAAVQALHGVFERAAQRLLMHSE